MKVDRFGNIHISSREYNLSTPQDAIKCIPFYCVDNYNVYVEKTGYLHLTGLEIVCEPCEGASFDMDDFRRSYEEANAERIECSRYAENDFAYSYKLGDSYYKEGGK